MYYYNYNPFYMRNRNYYYNRNMQNISENVESEKKDTESQQSDTISFQKFYNNNVNKNTKTKNFTKIIFRQKSLLKLCKALKITTKHNK